MAAKLNVLKGSGAEFSNEFVPSLFILPETVRVCLKLSENRNRGENSSDYTYFMIKRGEK